MQAITIHAPWAWAIVHGHKRIENRSWTTSIRGRVAIHAGASTVSDKAAEKLFREIGIEYPDDWSPYRSKLLGSVEIVDVISDCDQTSLLATSKPTDFGPWWTGPNGFVLKSPKPLSEPIRCSGQLRFWNLPSNLDVAFAP